MKVVIKAIKISQKRIMEYPFECIMLFFHIMFQFLFMVIFWGTITSNFSLPDKYSQIDIYLYNGLILFSNSISNCYSGAFRLPFSINRGELDAYLIRPYKPIFLYMLDHINIFVIIEQLLISLFYIGYFYTKYYSFDFIKLIYTILLLVIGTIILRLISMIISFSSFWIGINDYLHTLLNSFQDLQKYPLGIFEKSIQMIFTFVIPLGLVSYYPFEILIGNYSFNYSTIFVYLFSFIIVLIVYRFVREKGLAKYESNN